MAEFKLTIADPKSGKCMQKTVTDQAAKSLVGLKIGETVKGESLDLTGYEFLITGGSDFCGFPMRKGISGARKRILIQGGVGFRGGKKGIRRRRNVCGESITDGIVQINLKIMKKGKKAIVAEKKEVKEEAEEKPKEAPKEEKPKEEAKPEKKAKEKPKEEAKPEKKEEKPKEEAKK